MLSWPILHIRILLLVIFVCWTNRLCRSRIHHYWLVCSTRWVFILCTNGRYTTSFLSFIVALNIQDQSKEACQEKQVHAERPRSTKTEKYHWRTTNDRWGCPAVWNTSVDTAFPAFGQQTSITEQAYTIIQLSSEAWPNPPIVCLHSYTKLFQK